MTETVGSTLKRQRELRGMSVSEVSRVTRIPVASIEAIESGHFDDLPGEIFVRGFLRSYAQSVGLVPSEIVARYTASRRSVQVTHVPVPSSTSGREAPKRRFGFAIALVLLLILVTLALSIVLRPRGRGVPLELSRTTLSGEALRA